MTLKSKGKQVGAEQMKSDFVRTNFDLPNSKGVCSSNAKEAHLENRFKMYSLDQQSIFAMELFNKVTIEFVEMKSFF